MRFGTILGVLLLTFLCLSPVLAQVPGSTVSSSVTTAVFSSPAPTASKAEDEGGDPASVIGPLLEAYHDKRYTVCIGGLLTLLVGVFHKAKLGDRFPPEYQKWLTMGLAMLGAIGVGLQAGKRWDDVLLTGAIVGWCSIGAFETLWKPTRNVVDKARKKDEGV